MQIGGHVELNETPWQSIAHELSEESGYALDELSILQPDDQLVRAPGAVQHPVPVIMNTHKLPGEHFHSDLCFAFVAEAAPSGKPAEGESQDLRCLTIPELQAEADQGLAPIDIKLFYEAMITRYLPSYHRVPATKYALDKPSETML